jgi:hypothetical protein
MKTVIVFAILIIITIILFYFQNYTSSKFNRLERFEPLDRTKLYGSLFLDGLDNVIKKMTNPDIEYDTKRMQLFRYYDTLY